MRLGEPLALDAALISTAVEDRQGLRLCGTLSEEAYRALLTRKTKAGRARQHGTRRKRGGSCVQEEDFGNGEQGVRRVRTQQTSPYARTHAKGMHAWTPTR